MTRTRVHIHHEAGLSHQRIAALTLTSVCSVQRVLAEAEPTTDELAAGRLSRPTR
jgi:hypothetical protein